MAKGQKALAAEMKKRDEMYATQYQTAATAVKEPSEAEKQREGERKAHFDWKAAGDYRKPPPGLINLALSDPARERQKREMEATAVGTGVFGLGSADANPTAVALAKQNLADTNATEAAANYEGQLRAEDLYQRTDNSGVLMAQDWARKMGMLGSASGMTQFQTGARMQTTPQSLLPMILSSFAKGASAGLSMYATGGMGGGGGGGGGFSAGHEAIHMA